ncbi:MAG: FAD:protein FMN transferase [Acidobacteria bacterium]|nr:FAD:protein FMN transferase [Acidobacteriota bacterium]MBI3658790.1 FAD:protein FMN transferase [Acidobacteriota bacterium]
MRKIGDSAKHRRLVGILLLIMGLFSVSILYSSPLTLCRRAHYVMGTVFEISAYGEEEAATIAAIEEAFGFVLETDRLMSSYRPQSDLMELNSNASRGFVPVHRELYQVIQAAIGFSEMSDGAFDITVGPLMRAWGFFRQIGRVPPYAERQALLSKVGYRHIHLDPFARAVRFDVPDMEIDLGGIAKGWAVDRAAAVLRARGIQRALIDAGTSSLLALGTPPNADAWSVGIKDPLRTDRVLSIVGLKNQSLSTSGSYERFVRVSGKRYSHILDPKTGLPVNRMLSTTVIAPTATASDALSTAVFVMGADKGESFLYSHGYTGLLVYREKGQVKTRAIEPSRPTRVY